MISSTCTSIPWRAYHVDVSGSHHGSPERLQKLLQVHYFIPILIYPLFDLFVVRIVGVLFGVELLWKILCRDRVIVQGVVRKLRGTRVHDVRC
jgi:hypothetical protein